MATEAVQPRVSSRAPRTAPAHRPVNRTAERIFFAGMAILLCAIVVFGFSRTYFAAGMVAAPLPNALVHVHGAAFTLWMLLFLTQTALISARRVAWHRALGTVAFCLPPIMIVLGMAGALDALRRNVSIHGLPLGASLAIPLFNISTFAILILAGWRTRRRPDAHKRWVLYATIALTEAAIGRFPEWTHFGIPAAIGMQVLLTVVLLLPIVYDLVALHRVHRTSLWAAGLTLALAFAAVPVGLTPPWQSFTAFLAHYVAPYL